MGPEVQAVMKSTRKCGLLVRSLLCTLALSGVCVLAVIILQRRTDPCISTVRLRQEFLPRQGRPDQNHQPANSRTRRCKRKLPFGLLLIHLDWLSVLKGGTPPCCHATGISSKAPCSLRLQNRPLPVRQSKRLVLPLYEHCASLCVLLAVCIPYLFARRASENLSDSPRRGKVRPPGRGAMLRNKGVCL